MHLRQNSVPYQMHFYPACFVLPPGEKKHERKKERENKPHVADIANVVQFTLRSYSNTVLVGKHDLIQKHKVALGTFLYHRPLWYLTQAFAFITIKNEY